MVVSDRSGYEAAVSSVHEALVYRVVGESVIMGIFEGRRFAIGGCN